MQTSRIDKVAKKYEQLSLWLTTGLAMAGMIVYSVYPLVAVRFPDFISAIILTVVYQLVACFAYGRAWQAVVKSSPVTLTRFYLVGSILKLMTAALTFLVGALIFGKAKVVGFTVVFMTFFILHLILDCVYFARIEKQNITNQDIRQL